MVRLFFSAIILLTLYSCSHSIHKNEDSAKVQNESKNEQREFLGAFNRR